MRLAPLSEKAGFTFPAGALDVRGWEVRTRADREKVGEVHDIIIDENDRVRYLDVELGSLKRHVLIPTDRTEADADESVVWIPGLSRDQLERIPAYEHDIDAVTSSLETELAGAYDSASRGENYYARPEYAASRPAAGDPSPAATRLATLDELDDFEVAEGEPDPRGWEVLVADGRVIGRIDQLIVDTSAMKVRYLECTVDEAGLGLEEHHRHVLIPVGFARLIEDEERVVVDCISSEDIARMPIHEGLPLEREQEERIHGTFTLNPPDARR